MSQQPQGYVPDMPIGSIKIKPRFRKDMGDLDGLAAGIRAVGLLQPILVSRDGVLLAGERRLRACKLLGWSTIPATIREGAANE